MDTEEITDKAIRITRKMLSSILENHALLSFMSAGRCAPEDIEDTVAEVLKYLEKTAPEEAEG